MRTDKTNPRRARGARSPLLFGLALIAAMAQGTAAETIYYVDHDAPGPHDGTSWTRAFLHPDDALAVVVDDDEIWVGMGTYQPAPNGFMLVSGVRMYGGFIGYTTGPGGFETATSQHDPTGNPTILSGDYGGSNATYVVQTIGGDSGTRLDGFTITGALGHGMLSSSSNVRIIDCIFDDNDTIAFGFPPAIDGGGLLIDGGSPVLRRVTFVDNYARDGGGGVACFTASPRFEECLFTGNVADGAGSLDGRGGGLMCDDGTNATVTDCRFESNNAEDGGGIALVGGSVVTLVDVAVVLNTADAGGGIYARRADDSGIPVVWTNCTIADNSSIIGGGGIFLVQNSSPDIDSTILYGNRAFGGLGGEGAQISISGDSNPTLDSCCIEGLTGTLGGLRNIDGPPGFVSGDYALALGSACIDVGDTNKVPVDNDEDIAGEVRRANDVYTVDHGFGLPPDVDIGAWEYQPDCNENGISDAVDIAEGTTADDDGDGAPDVCEGAWTKLGNGLAGTDGIPNLRGKGTLHEGHTVTMTLTKTRTNTTAALVIGLTRIDHPFKGGVMVPEVDLVVLGIPTGGSGSIQVAGEWPGNIPASFSTYYQWWITDPVGPQGFAASNGLSSETAPWTQ